MRVGHREEGRCPGGWRGPAAFCLPSVPRSKGPKDLSVLLAWLRDQVILEMCKDRECTSSIGCPSPWYPLRSLWGLPVSPFEVFPAPGWPNPAPPAPPYGGGGPAPALSVVFPEIPPEPLGRKQYADPRSTLMSAELRRLSFPCISWCFLCSSSPGWRWLLCCAPPRQAVPTLQPECFLLMSFVTLYLHFSLLHQTLLFSVSVSVV